MAQPPRYERKKDFAEDYADNTDHVALNAELDGVAQTTDAIRANLALLQRDDGALKNGIVTADSLDQGLLGDIVVAVSGDIDDKVQQATAAATDSVNASINSQNAAANSQGYAEQSLSYVGASQAAAQNSAASRDRAQEWAEKLSGPVTENLYSAHYWAEQAKTWAEGSADNITVVPTAIQPASNAQDAIDFLSRAAIDHASDVAPLVAWPYMTWADTGNMLLKRRNSANSAWVTIGPLLEEMAAKADLGFTIIYPNGGSAVSPASLSANSRYLEANPFPGFRVFCQAEVLVSGSLWGTTGWLSWVDNAAVPRAWGVAANQHNNDGIAVTVGVNGCLSATVNASGSSFGAVGALVSAQCRVKVWKVLGKI